MFMNWGAVSPKVVWMFVFFIFFLHTFAGEDGVRAHMETPIKGRWKIQAQPSRLQIWLGIRGGGEKKLHIIRPVRFGFAMPHRLWRWTLGTHGGVGDAQRRSGLYILYVAFHIRVAYCIEIRGLCWVPVQVQFAISIERHEVFWSSHSFHGSSVSVSIQAGVMIDGIWANYLYKLTARINGRNINTPRPRS
jgi:hypothetical protein